MPFDGRNFKIVEFPKPGRRNWKAFLLNPFRSKRFTIDEFRDWVKTMNPEQTYKYEDVMNCPIAQFLKATGRSMFPLVVPFASYIPDGLDYNVGCGRETYGELAKRLG